MNEATKNIKKELENLDITYETTSDKNSIIFQLFNEQLNISIRYLIQTVEFDNDEYLLTIITSSIFKVKNELNVLKTINNLNWNNTIINYLISDEQNTHVILKTFDTLNSISEDVIVFVKEITDDLEKNYDELMKSNWS